MEKSKIILIKSGSFSHINESVIQMLRDAFPKLELDVVDIYDLLKKDKLLIFSSLFSAIKEYGIKVFSRKFISYFFSSGYLFHKIRHLVSDYVSKDEYLFTFQTQSFFDMSIEGIPHFVYTDATILSNLYYPDTHIQDLPPQWRLDLEKTVYQNATANLTMSNHIRRSMIEHYACDPSKVFCVYAGSNLEVDSPLNENKYHSKNILFVGVEWERKGGPQLVEAFKEVLKTHSDAQLTIVGCSPPVNVPNCVIVGRVPLQEVDQYYERAAVFCMPTKREPFGIVCIEALTHKLPVVTTDIGAMPDFVKNEETGYLVRPGDVKGLAQVLSKLLGNPGKCKALGENGYHMVIERYSWKKVGEMVRSIIQLFLPTLS